MTVAVASETKRPTKRVSAREAAAKRARGLVNQKVDFIPNAEFRGKEATAEILGEEWIVEGERDGKLPSDLPGHLARMCEAALLTAEEEADLFRRMNFLKYRAHELQQEVDVVDPDSSRLDELQAYLDAADAIRDRIVQSNMRLVISIVKKFVTPQNSFDDMLSDGIMSLMHAVDKFDYDRGYRFSTYAYRAIARNAYRMVTDKQKENTRFATGADYVVLDAPVEDRSSPLNDHAWERLRHVLGQLMDRLDRRERFILRGRYALGAHRKVRTFQCLADKLGVSKERVRQLEQRAVNKLKSMAAEFDADDLIEPAFSGT